MTGYQFNVTIDTPFGELRDVPAAFDVTHDAAEPDVGFMADGASAELVALYMPDGAELSRTQAVALIGAAEVARIEEQAADRSLK
jgi:hypothetical protein